ncbi:hypothetical protein P7E02_12175 [Enterococcus hulanensis]|uniref:hypothetical protein n=1 Tax=Enterococcus hulanensis TaxID=2559929 RepID=UPI00288D8E8E|nr:hypothetical protein [Enterococcus hulanensis]MDT2660630.1 hypothetical protein [Enterococcus hulanensis]
MGMQISFFVKDQPEGCYFEKVQASFYEEEENIETLYPKDRFDAILDEALLRILRKVFDTLEKIGEVEEYLQFLDFNIENPYNSAFVSKHFLLYKNADVESLMNHVLMEVAEPLAEGYFESMIDYLETNIDDEVFVDFRLNGEELLLEVQSQGKKVSLTEPLKQLVIDYDESFERVATEFLESFI